MEQRKETFKRGDSILNEVETWSYQKLSVFKLIS